MSGSQQRNVASFLNKLNESFLAEDKSPFQLCKLVPTSDNLCLIEEDNGKIKWVQPSGTPSHDQITSHT